MVVSDFDGLPRLYVTDGDLHAGRNHTKTAPKVEVAISDPVVFRRAGFRGLWSNSRPLEDVELVGDVTRFEKP